MKTVVIKVFMNEVSFKFGAKVFERILTISDSISVDVSSLVGTLRFLFGSSAVVEVIFM